MKTQENKKMNHTPTPWVVVPSVQDRNGDGCTIRSLSNRLITIATMMRPEDRKANADFIVTVCNAHDYLISVLEECQDFLEQRADAEYEAGNPYAKPNKAMRLLVEVKEALAKAQA